MRNGRRSSGYNTQARWKIAITLVITMAMIGAGAYFIRQYALFTPLEEAPDSEPAEAVFSTSTLGDYTNTIEQQDGITMTTEPNPTVEAESDPAPKTEPSPDAGEETPSTVQGEEPPDASPPEPNPVNPAVTVNEYGIYSKAALLLDLETGETLFSLLEEEQIPPASLAKMMTAIVAIEECDNLNTSVTITDDMLIGLIEAGASTAGFMVGETVTILDLLYGCMLPSGADATNALAFATAGSVEDFVALMNEKATAIGMVNTSFANTHGLTADNLYSTCTDLAKLLTYCLQNKTFRTLFTTATYTTTATPQHPKGIGLQNKVALAIADQDLINGHIIGNKVGFTTPAGQCLASLAEINGREYILITVGAGKTGYNTHRFNLLDALYLYNTIAG